MNLDESESQNRIASWSLYTWHGSSYKMSYTKHYYGTQQILDLDMAERIADTKLAQKAQASFTAMSSMCSIKCKSTL